MALFPLPDIITLESSGGDWDRYLEAIYQEFVDRVAKASLTFRELPLSCPRKPEFNGMHYSFWHLITEDRERWSQKFGQYVKLLFMTKGGSLI